MIQRLFVTLFALLLAGCAGVTFQSAVDQLRVAPRQSVKLSAHLMKPEGVGPFPAVVLMHGCDGINSNQLAWARELQKEGFVALVVDSFGPRWVSENCSSNRTVSGYDRTEDAYGALNYLASMPFVDSKRVGIIGWSQGAQVVVRVLSADGYGKQLAGGKKFFAGVAYYPGCSLPGSYYKFPDNKFLVLVGEDDQWTPSANCKTYAERGAVVYVFPRAHHGFDNPNAPQVPTIVRGAAPPMSGTSPVVAYNPEAAVKAARLTKEFLKKNLGESGGAASP